MVMVMSPGAYDSPYTAVRHPLGDLPGRRAVRRSCCSRRSWCCSCLRRLAADSVQAGRRDRRAQLKWLALAALGVPGTALLSWLGLLLQGTHDLAGIGTGGARFHLIAAAETSIWSDSTASEHG